MSSSFTYSKSNTFTLTEAKYLAAKVVTDLQRCQQIYGSPPSDMITPYHEELIALLKSGYLKSYEFGYEKDDVRVVTWKYTVEYGDLTGGNDTPGSMYRKADISGASFFNYVCPSSEWWGLSDDERAKFNRTVPFQRTGHAGYTDGNGSWKLEKAYSATGCLITRESFVPFN